MKHFVRSIGALAAAATLLAAAGHGAWAQERAKAIEDLLPADTLALVTIHDVGDLRRDFEKTGLSRIANEPEIQAFVDTFWSGLERYWRDLETKFEESTGARLADVLDTLQGEVAFAFTGMDTTAEEPIPGIVVTIEAKKNLELALRVIASMRTKIGEENPNVRFSSRQFDGLTIETVASDEMTFHYAVQGGGLYFSMDGALLEGVLRSYAGSPGATLASHPTFRAVKERLGLSSENYLVYLNVGQLLETFGEQIPPDAMSVFENLGLTSWDGLAFGGEFEENEWREVFAAYVPGEKKGLSYLFSKHGPVDLSVARRVPMTAHGLSGLVFDPAGLWDEVRATIRRFDAGAADGFDKAVAEFERERNVEVRDDLLGNLSGSMYGYSYRPSGGSLFSSGVSFVGVKDAARFEQAIEKLLAGQTMFESRTSEYRGRKIRYLLVPQGQLGENPFEGADSPDAAIGWALQFAFGSFAWYVEDGWIVTSNLVQSLKDHIDHADSGASTSLADSAEFQAAAKRFGSEASFVVYYDPEFDVGQIYNTGLQLLKIFEGLIRAAGVPLDVALLPRASTILRHVGPSAYAVRLDGDGMAFEGAALVPGNFLAFAGVGVAAAIGVPAVMQARVRANETSAMGTLKALATAQEQFRMNCLVDQDGDGTGEYAFFQELAGTAIVRGGREAAQPSFMSPSFGETATRNDGVAEKSGYYFRIYLPGRTEATAETGAMPEPDVEAANMQETSWVAYAWPAEFEKTGRRAFVMNQEGQVYESHNYSTMYSGLDNAPRADAAFDLDQSEDAKNLQGSIAAGGGRSGDGGFWSPSWGR